MLYNSNVSPLDWNKIFRNLNDSKDIPYSLPDSSKNQTTGISTKDLEAPLSKKWNPPFHNSIILKLKQQRQNSRYRIRSITNGLTMPEKENVPIGSAKKMVAAILFLDLEEFTSTTSKLSNEVVLHMLNTIIPVLMYIVKRWSGEIEKNTGDGLMAVFGTETRNDFLIARDAIESAMAMRYVMLKNIHPKFSEEGIPLLNFRIGVDMEEVLISRVGIKDTNFLTVVGSAANRASKLQALAESNGICIGENMYNNLHTALHQFCKEGKHPDWQWYFPKTKQPYRFFHYKFDWPEPKEWINRKTR